MVKLKISQMSFTVIFSDDEDIKKQIAESTFGENKIIISKNFKQIKKNYERALIHLKNNIFYDFFKFRKRLKNYKYFKLEKELSKLNADITKCPLCDEFIIGIHDHLKKDLDDTKVIVLFDSSVTSENKQMIVEQMSVKEIKNIVYDKIGMSVSKQEVLRNNEILSNNIILKGETVVIRQKRRSNKKN